MIWTALALTTGLVIIAGTWRLSVTVIPLLAGAEGRIVEFRQISLGDVLERDSSQLGRLKREVERARGDLRSVSQQMLWIGRFSPSVPWLPIAGPEIAAWSSQIKRLEWDIEAASVLLDSSSRLVDVYRDSQSALLAAGEVTSVPSLQADIIAMEEAFATGLSAASHARSAGKSFSVALQAPRVRDYMALLDHLESRMSNSGMVGEQLSAMLAELLELANGIRPLIAQFASNGTEPEPLTSETLKATLATMVERAESARGKGRQIKTLIADTGEASGLLPTLDALDQFLTAMGSVGKATMITLDVVEPVALSMEGSRTGPFGAGGNLGGIVDPVLDNRDRIEESIAELERAELILSRLKSRSEASAFGSKVPDISKLVSELHIGLRLLNGIAPMWETAVGMDGAKRYLVLGQSADELRGTGGFVSSVWLITLENGVLSDVRYEDSVRVDDWERLLLYPKAPPGLEEHMNAWVWLLRDVSWDPDFPTTAQTAKDMYRLGQRQNVDGVIAINQWSLLRLVEGLGSIPSPDGEEPVTARNLLSVLEQGTDTHGRAYTERILRGVLDRIDQPMSMPTLVKLASGVADSLQERDTLVYFEDPGLQSMVGELGWDGRVSQVDHDYLYVVDSNVGWSKVDRNIQRDIAYVVDLRESPRPRASLSLQYVNHSGPGSPPCEPQWLSRGSDYSQQKNACYWNFLRVYIPQGSRLLGWTPLPLPELSVSAETGRGTPGQDTSGVMSRHNRMVFSGLTTLEAGERKEISLAYDLPASILRDDDDSLRYRLLIQKQPGVRNRNVTVDFILPDDLRLASSSMSPLRSDESRPSFSLVLDRDLLLDVEFEKETSGPY